MVCNCCFFPVSFGLKHELTHKRAQVDAVPDIVPWLVANDPPGVSLQYATMRTPYSPRVQSAALRALAKDRVGLIQAESAVVLAWSPVVFYQQQKQQKEHFSASEKSTDADTSSPLTHQPLSAAVLLAVGMRNGTVVLWQMSLPRHHRRLSQISSFRAGDSKNGPSEEGSHDSEAPQSRVVGVVPAHSNTVTALAWAVCDGCGSDNQGVCQLLFCVNWKDGSEHRAFGLGGCRGGCLGDLIRFLANRG